MLNLALPNHQNPPAQLLQFPDSLLIPRYIAGQFRRPVLDPARWNSALAAAFMLMPKTAVYKNHALAARKYEVRLPGQIPRVQPETVTHTMNKAAHDALGCGILAAYAAHIF